MLVAEIRLEKLEDAIISQKAKLYHWTNLQEIPGAGLIGDLETNYTICFSIDPTTHSHFGKYCYSIEVYPRDIPPEYLSVFNRREEILKQIKTGESFEESDVEICFPSPIPKRMLKLESPYKQEPSDYGV